MNTTKKAGRPKKFDRNTVLGAALGVFWKKGYHGTSLKDLTAAMNINGPSLYAEFGDKLALYEQVIDRYIESDACAPLVAFEQESDIYQAVYAFMDASIDYATTQKNGVRGCFLASCVVVDAGDAENIQQRLQRAIEATDLRISERFEYEKKAGKLAKDFPSLERARLMFDLRQGHVFRARAGYNPDSLKADLHKRARMVTD